MSGEAAFWRYLREGMRGLWDAQRHEDRLSAGVPDVSYAIDGADGWLELKALGRWPARAQTPVRIGVSPEQVAWLETRGRAGSGRCFILARVGRTHLLFRWDQARALAGGMLMLDMLAAAKARWERSIDFKELARILGA